MDHTGTAPGCLIDVVEPALTVKALLLPDQAGDGAPLRPGPDVRPKDLHNFVLVCFKMQSI